MSLWVVVGGQFGSEGKGKVSAFITCRENIDICVRCGGPNSGHSFVDQSGKTVILRQLPTGYINPDTRLLIPAGALIDPVVLKHEIELLSLAPSRIGIDRNCFIIEARDRRMEQDLGLRERVSSTLVGVGAAVSRRALRGKDARLARDPLGEHPWLADLLTDVSFEVNSALDKKRNVLIEGTQGVGLSLYHTQYYPHCTSRDTSASAFLSEVGVSPRLVTEIVVVFRTFPIRVSGAQAGPMKEEISWQRIRTESGYPHEIEERTSVTNKLRRVARFDWDLFQRAVAINRPTRLAINGLDYLDYTNFELKEQESLSPKAKRFLADVEGRVGVPVKYIGVGPRIADMIESSRSFEDKPKSNAAYTANGILSRVN